MLTNLLQKLGWVALEDHLPPKNMVVDWYDAMFDRIDTFSMKDPGYYDPDYTHWCKRSTWVSVKDKLPEIPKGKHAVQVLCSVYDPIYEELNPGKGSSVIDCMFGGEDFVEFTCGPKGAEWYPVIDEVTHWMYYPKAARKEI